MRTAVHPVRLRVEAMVARLYYGLGLPGVAGLVLLVVAAGLLLRAWPPRELDEPMSRAGALPSQAASELRAFRSDPADAFPPPSLPGGSDIPLLLTRIERAAQEQELGWPKADYRLQAATGDTPAALEVRTVLSGPYVRIRQFVTTVLLDMPSLTLKEFVLSRPSAEANQVEARLTLLVYLRSGRPRVAEDDL